MHQRMDGTSVGFLGMNILSTPKNHSSINHKYQIQQKKNKKYENSLIYRLVSYTGEER